MVATKVFFQTDDDEPNSGGLSRKTIEQELDASLARLGTDTVDLYQIHRWDDDTPIAETVRALDDAVRREKVRYLGASSMWAYQFADALHTSDALGAERFVSMQNHYNLLYREEEREMLPLCSREGVGVVPWSPLARGYLARPHEQKTATTRGQSDAYARRHPYMTGGGREINERVQQIAADEGLTMAQVALAWLLERRPSTLPSSASPASNTWRRPSRPSTCRCQTPTWSTWRSRTNPCGSRDTVEHGRTTFRGREAVSSGCGAGRRLEESKMIYATDERQTTTAVSNVRRLHEEQ